MIGIYNLPGSIPIDRCFRCGNDLLYKEIKAKEMYCAACKKIKADDAHREQLSNSIHKANNRGRMV